MTLDEFKKVYTGKSYSYFPYQIKSKIDDVITNEKMLIVINKHLINRDCNVAAKRWIQSNSMLLNLYGGTYFIQCDSDNMDDSFGSNSSLCVFIKYRNYLNLFDVDSKEYPSARYNYDSNNIRWLCEITLFSKFTTPLSNTGTTVYWNSMYLDATGNITEILDTTLIEESESVLKRFSKDDGYVFNDVSEVSIFNLAFKGQLVSFMLKDMSVIPKLCTKKDICEIDIMAYAQQSVYTMLEIFTSFYKDVKWH